MPPELTAAATGFRSRLHGGVDLDALGTEGTIAQLLGQPCHDRGYVARMVQQCFRDMSHHGPAGDDGSMSYAPWALYLQLTGSWTEEDQALYGEMIRLSWIPSMIEGPRGLAHEARLTPEAAEDLARSWPLP